MLKSGLLLLKSSGVKYTAPGGFLKQDSLKIDSCKGGCKTGTPIGN